MDDLLLLLVFGSIFFFYIFFPYLSLTCTLTLSLAKTKANVGCAYTAAIIQMFSAPAQILLAIIHEIP